MAYKEGREGTFVVLVYRDSGDAQKRRERETEKTRLIRHGRHFIRYLQKAGRIGGKASFVAIRGSGNMSRLIPQFIGDLEIE